MKIDDVPLGRRETRFYSSAWNQGRHSDTGFEGIIFPFLNELDEVCRDTGYSMIELAFGFLKAQEGVSSILVGARDEGQLETNLRAFGKTVPEDVISRITKLSEPLKNAMGNNADLWQNDDNGRVF
jgi:aryl-alcohol dehydrogenase-like predicted oxidoreductase